MGNTCQFLDSSNENKYLEQERDEPSPSYALEIRDELPSDIYHLRKLFENQTVTEPTWYRAGESLKIDSMFYVKRYDLYYRGEWKKGVPHGFGEVITQDGQYFKGYFKEGVARGPKSLFAMSPTTFYIGAVDFNQRNGNGKFVDGDYSYEGQWFESFPNGKGKEVFPNGDVYKGDFVQGKKDGDGQYNWKAGEFESFVGKFSKNEMSGSGELLARDGRVWKGDFCCSKDFLLENAECRYKSKVFRGTLRNLTPDKEFKVEVGKDEKDNEKKGQYQLNFKEGKLYGRGSTDKSFSVFQNRILTYYDQTASTEELNAIIKAIENGYQNCKKHSEALQAIKKGLPDYDCSFWSDNREKTGLLIAPICGRQVRVGRETQL